MNGSAVNRTCASVFLPLLMAFLSVAIALPTHAGVVVSGTRVVYKANQKDVSIWLKNNNDKPALVQIWMDGGDENASPENARVPFVAMPPIFRLEPNKQQVVRLVYTGEALPSDKESLFWFNVLEVPPKAQSNEAENQLQFAFRSRLKLFFRPEGLPYDVSEAPGKLRWQLVNREQGPALQVHNPTPYNVNFDSVVLVAADKRYVKPEGQVSSENMVGPGASNLFPLPDLKSLPGADAQVEFKVIDDIGSVSTHTQKISR